MEFKGFTANLKGTMIKHIYHVLDIQNCVHHIQCMNGGTCVAGVGQDYHCECGACLTGQLCETILVIPGTACGCYNGGQVRRFQFCSIGFF